MSDTASSIPLKTKAFAAFEWMVAGRYLRARRREGFVSVIAGFSLAGIALGVATLIIVMSVMNGFRQELLGKILGVNGHAMVQSLDGELLDYDPIAEHMRKLPGVKSAVPMVEGQAMASSQFGAAGVLVRGFKLDDLLAKEYIAGRVIAGSLLALDETSISLGSRLARQLGVGVGDTVSLISPRGRATPFGVAPRIVGYRVAAIYEVGMSEYDNTLAHMTLEAAQNYFNRQGKATAVEIMVDNPDNMDPIRPVLEQALREIVDDPKLVDNVLRLFDWRDLNQTFFSALQVERNVMFLILTLIILVAALNIISGMIMLVKDKAHDIAILRTMGMTRGSVLRIFFIAGASIGTTGTLLGVALGTAFCMNIEELRQFLSRLSGTELFSPEIYFLSRLPAIMDVGEVVTVCLMALGLSFIATIYPAARASRLDPVEALRYE